MKSIIDHEKCYNRKIEIIKPLLFNFIKSKIYNYQDAEDILQNTLLILVDKQSSFLYNKSFYSWAFTICRFQIRRFLTESSRSREFTLPQNLDSAESSELDPFLILDQKEILLRKHHLARLIERKYLSTRELEFLTLFKEGKSRSEIMNLMNIQRGSYYQYRARVANRFAKHSNLNEQEV